MVTLLFLVSTTSDRSQLSAYCLLQGFMEGGELHGIVSIKVLDASKRKEVTAG